MCVCAAPPGKRRLAIKDATVCVMAMRDEMKRRKRERERGAEVVRRARAFCESDRKRAAALLWRRERERGQSNGQSTSGVSYIVFY